MCIRDRSTLLNMLGGLDYPTSGGVSIRGVEFSRLNDNQLTIFRRRNIDVYKRQGGGENGEPEKNHPGCGEQCLYEGV